MTIHIPLAIRNGKPVIEMVRDELVRHAGRLKPRATAKAARFPSRKLKTEEAAV